jgi:hypothetical protein
MGYETSILFSATVYRAAWPCLISLVLVAVMASETGAFDEKVQRIPTRPGVTQAFLLVKPAEPPAASVILFAGDDGLLGLSDEGITWGKGNFLVRSRGFFAERGFLVAVVDAPSGRGGVGLANFRTTEAHAQDIAAVISFLKQAASVPVWLVGTSRGTISAANVGARFPRVADGLVLTSSVTRRSKRSPDSLLDVNLADIERPTLFVHHKNDRCVITPYADIAGTMGELKRAPKVELLSFEGGEAPRSDPCDPLSYHGYLGLESLVVDAIAAWIKATSQIP